jgi:hypothetical protein
MKKLIAAMLISTAAVAAPVMADDDCRAPMESWQSEQAFRDAIEARGWQITEFEVDDGCYEMHGLDDQQRRIEAAFDPVSFEMIEMEVKR